MLRAFEADDARRMYLDIAVRDADISAARGQENFLFGRRLNFVRGRDEFE